MRFSIGKKLVVSFLLVVMLLLITNSISHYYFMKVDSSYSDLVKRRSVILANAEKLQGQVYKRSSGLRGYLLTKEESFSQDVDNAIEGIDQTVDNTLILVKRDVDRERLQTAKSLNQVYKQRAEKVIQMRREGVPLDKVIHYYEQEMIPLGNEMDPLVEGIVKDQYLLMTDGTNQNTDLVTSIGITLYVMSGVAAILAIFIGWFMTRVLSKPVLAIAKAAERISSGDLTHGEIRIKNKDEIGDLSHSFNNMASSLRHLINQVSVTSEQVVSYSEELRANAEQATQATHQIASSFEEVANGTEIQGNSVEESARAITEMAKGIQQVAETSSSVSDEAIESTMEARRGNESLQKVIQQMNSIVATTNQTSVVIEQLFERSKQIEKIIDMITGIADQTNLLSLNAAIESARAGEHGRGFAVVANEVRKLSEQSRHSADQISALIHDIQKDTETAVKVMEKGTKEVEIGIALVHETGSGFANIVKSIDNVSGQIQELSAVTEEMSASLEQVSATIEEMANLAKETTRNAQNVASASEEQLSSMDEITSSAAALATMADDLQSVIVRFKI
ncbi:methyl-accepting chemotaxis protein [Brevibacillus fluminis]|uniref:methyl-accepting chemotaxis protein n=1 Tax=Brevibacillus fluminis TaxID=511487 RepID=UPI003F891385